MTTLAIIRHASPGRVRLGLPERKGDLVFFEELELRIRGIEGVHRAKSNPLTGSLTVEHHAEIQDVLSAAEVSGLFSLMPPELGEEGSPSERLTKSLSHVIGGWDRKLRDFTADEIDLKVLALFAFGGLAIWQLRRGKWLPAGLTLAMQGLNFMQFTGRR